MERLSLTVFSSSSNSGGKELGIDRSKKREFYKACVSGS
jgi:hypothetical protein